MVRFSISDVAMTGFRVVRERPRTVLVWAAFQLVFSVLLQGMILATASPAILAMAASPRVLEPTQAVALMGQMMRVAVVVLPVWLAYHSILLAAMCRVVLRPAEDRFGYLRLGSDELRQLGLVVLAGLVFFAIGFAVAFGAALLLALTSGGAPSPASLLAILFLLYAALIMVAVRFSLASPLTFDRGKVDLFGSWRLTRGRFWPLFGTLVLTLALSAVISVLAFVIIGALQLIVAGGDFATVFAPVKRSSAADVFSPPGLLALALNAVVAALVWPVMLTPAPEIYRVLIGAGQSPDPA